jgi:hypothetical protein
MYCRPWFVLATFVVAPSIARAQAPYSLLATTDPASTSSWTCGPLASATDLDPYGFAVQGPPPGAGARVAVFARAEAPPETIGLLVERYGANHGINLVPETAPFQPTSPFATFAMTGAPLEVTHGHVADFLLAMAAAPVTAAPERTVPWSEQPFPGLGGQGTAWPAYVPGWTAATYNMIVWTPSFVVKTPSSAVPGGSLTTYSLSRMVERSILLQSTNPLLAREFIRSAAYGEAFSNQFTLIVQACIILPPTSAGGGQPTIPVFTTTAFRTYVNLTPGGDDPEAPSSAFVSRTGLIFEGADNEPVILALGIVGDPIEVKFENDLGESFSGLYLMSIAPADPYCPYYAIWRPPGLLGRVQSVILADDTIGDVPHCVLPPLAGLPLLDFTAVCNIY